MKLIVGLGNPGLVYAYSRHNIGFSVVKSLAKTCKVSLKRDSGTFALSAKARIGTKAVILATPLTFMNLSGASVKGLVKKYKIGLSGLLVVLDDLDLEPGRIKIRPAGSSAGHRGLESIIDSLGTPGFARLRVGIGRPRKNLEASEYVLSPFSKKEKPEVKRSLEEAGRCCRAWSTEGIVAAMNTFNKRSGLNE